MKTTDGLVQSVGGRSSMARGRRQVGLGRKDRMCEKRIANSERLNDEEEAFAK